MTLATRQALATVATGLLLLALLWRWGEASVRTLLPALQSVFEHCVPEFKVLAFGLDHEQVDRVLRVEVTRQHYVVLGGRAIEPNSLGSAQASTLALQTLFGPLLALWVALAWPSAGPWRRGLMVRGLRLSLAALPAVMLAVLDTPVVLAAQLWQLMVDHYAPGDTSALIAASAVLQGGGRFALGLAAGACAVAVAGRLTPTQGVSPNGLSPCEEHSSNGNFGSVALGSLMRARRSSALHIHQPQHTRSPHGPPEQ